MDKPKDLIEYVPDRPGHDKRYSIDSSKIERDVGWLPTYRFDEALQETVQWYKDNKEWWEQLAYERTLHPQPWTLSWK